MTIKCCEMTGYLSCRGKFVPRLGTVRFWQNGAALPTVDNLIVLAALFDVLIDDILVITHS